MSKSGRTFYERPKMRGHLHQGAFFTALGACILLMVKSTQVTTFIASLIFSLALLFLLAVSSLYHRVYWKPHQYALMKRLDHSAIFVLIAGTFTPFCLLALPDSQGRQLLMIIWLVALFGIMQAIFWVRAPKPLVAFFYVVMGWLVVPYLGELKDKLGLVQLLILGAGGIAYTVGAFFYALRKPNLFPTIFEHHELFHFFTIVGAALHFSVIYQLIV